MTNQPRIKEDKCVKITIWVYTDIKVSLRGGVEQWVELEENYYFHLGTRY